jgi:hypothetical protein
MDAGVNFLFVCVIHSGFFTGRASEPHGTSQSHANPSFFRSLCLEEQWNEVDQVVAPHHPGVKAGGFDLRDRHAFGL